MKLKARGPWVLQELADNVCSSVPGGGDPANLGGGGGGGTPPAPQGAAAQPPAPPAPWAPPAPPAPPAAPQPPAAPVNPEEFVAAQRRAVKAEKELQELRAQMKDPKHLAGVFSQVLGIQPDEDPAKALASRDHRAQVAEADARDARVSAVVVSLAAELNAHNPLDVAELFRPQAAAIELENGRVKDYTAAKTAVSAFLQSRPYLVRNAANPAAQPQQPPPTQPHPLGTPPPRQPELPAAPAGNPPFRLLTETEVWALTPEVRQQYISMLKGQVNGSKAAGLPWQS